MVDQPRMRVRNWSSLCTSSPIPSSAIASLRFSALAAGRAARDRPDQQPGNGVDDDGDDEQRQANLDQRARCMSLAASVNSLAITEAMELPLDSSDW